MEDPLAVESQRVGAAWLVQRCASAVNQGAPLYNLGAISECVELYENTLISLIRHGSSVPPPVLRLLQHAVDRCRGLISASRKAWEYRQALDRAVLMATTIAELSRSPSPVISLKSVAPPSATGVASGWEPSGRSAPRCQRSPRQSAEEASSAGAAAPTPTQPSPPKPQATASPPPPDNSPVLPTMSLMTVRASLPPLPHPPPPSRPSPGPRRRSQLLDLPNDLLPLILHWLPAASLGALARTCATLGPSAHACAADAVRHYQPSLFRGFVACAAPDPRWARTLHSLERLEARVGPCPQGRRWWEEWPTMRATEALLTTGNLVDPRTFTSGGTHSIKALLRHYAAGLQWMVDAGWSPLHSSTAMLLLACGSAAIGRSIRRDSSDFAASAHALSDALRQRAWAITTAAPPAYASIEGTFGLAAADAAWLELLDEGVEPGHSFVTSAPLQAAIHPTRLPDPAGGGPVHRVVSAACELRVGGPLVCFLSEQPPSSGAALHTLLQTSPIGFALPPLATITLVATHEPGEWHNGQPGGAIWRRCFCVKVSVPF